jgi:hypothetical protein
MNKHYFRITIGDHSGDGHDRRETIIVRSNKPMDEVSKTYTNACNIVPTEWQPEHLFCEYGEKGLSEDEYIQFVKHYGEDMLEHSKHTEKPWQCWMPEDFANIVLKFLQIGDKELELEIENFPRLEGDFGYGLFG